MTTRRGRGASSARRGGTAMNAVRLLRGLRRKDVNEVSRALDVERRGNDVDFMEKFRKLKMVAKQHKSLSRKQEDQFSWLRGYNRLSDTARNLEGEVKGMLSEAMSSGSRRRREKEARIDEFIAGPRSDVEMDKDNPLRWIIHEMEENNTDVDRFRQQLLAACRRVRSSVVSATRVNRVDNKGTSKKGNSARKRTYASARPRKVGRRHSSSCVPTGKDICTPQISPEVRGQIKGDLDRARKLMDDIAESLAIEYVNIQAEIDQLAPSKLARQRSLSLGANPASHGGRTDIARKDRRAAAARVLGEQGEQDDPEDRLSSFLAAFRFHNLQHQEQASKKLDKEHEKARMEIIERFRIRLDALDQNTARSLYLSSVEEEEKIQDIQQSILHPNLKFNRVKSDNEGGGHRYPRAQPDSSSILVPWLKTEEMKFRDICTTYHKIGKIQSGSSPRGKGRISSGLIKRLKLEFPDKPYRELRLRVHGYTLHQLFQRKKKALLSQWERDKRKLLEEANVQLRIISHSHAFQNEVKAEKDKENEQRAGIEEEYMQTKLKSLERQRIEAIEQRRKEEENRRLEAIREEELAKERDIKAQQLDLYHAELAAEKAVIFERQAEIDHQEEIRKRDQAALNLKRVEYRREKQSERERARMERDEGEAREYQLQQNRLDALRNKVAKKFDHVRPDRERVLQNTNSVQSRMDSKVHKPLFFNPGYTVDELMQDQRFKIQLALREAGLHTSEYARKVIENAPSRAPARPSMKSNFTLQDNTF
ncbi:hypothetical protein AAMO2058_001659800 [Amorphochlora amoebiformis]